MAPHELSEELYKSVSEWQTYSDFSDAERVAIEYAEKFATDHKALDDAFFARMREHFSDDEIFEISVCVGTWLTMGRITMVMDVEVSCPIRLALDEPVHPREGELA